MADPLAIWAVEISAGQGVQVLDAQLAGVNASLQRIDDATKNTGNTISKSMLTGTERVAILGAGYGYLAGKVMGFVNAGLAGSTEGERLHFVMERLNRQIASIFTPAIQTTIDKLAQLSNWFQNLTGDQQAQIRNITGMGLAFLGVATIVPQLQKAIVGLSISLVDLFRTNPILAIVSSVAALLVTTEEGRRAIGRMGAALLPLADIAASIAKALEPIAKMLAQIVNAAVTVIAPILEVAAAITSVIGPSVLLTVTFYTLGVVGTNAFLKMAASISLATAATGVMTGAVWLLNTALNALKAHPVIAVLSVIVGIVSFISGLFSKKDKDKERSELTQKPGPIESFEQTFNRIQQDIAKTDKAQEVRLRQLAVQEQIRDALRRRGAPEWAVNAVGP